MKIVLAFCSRYGAMRHCCEEIAAALGAGAVLVDLREIRRPELDETAGFFVGGSIYGGEIQREVPDFCERNRDLLLRAPVALGICCFYEGERAMAELHGSFPGWLTSHAFAAEPLGAELVHGRLNRLDRLLVKRYAGDSGDVSRIDHAKIAAIAERFRAILDPR